MEDVHVDEGSDGDKRDNIILSAEDRNGAADGLDDRNEQEEDASDASRPGMKPTILPKVWKVNRLEMRKTRMQPTNMRTMTRKGNHEIMKPYNGTMDNVTMSPQRKLTYETSVKHHCLIYQRYLY